MVKQIVRTRAGLAVVAAAISFSAGSVVAQDAPTKIGVINLDVVALQSPAGQQLQAETLALQQEVTAELERRQAAAREIEQRVATAGDTISADARRALEREYQDALTEFQRYQQDKQEEAVALRAEGLARIQQELGPVIEQIQAELGYDLVLNAQNPVVVIFSERIDITQTVIDRLAQEPANP